MLLVETRVLGKKARPLDRWSVPVPPAGEGAADGGLTLRDLIIRVVRSEVESFERRQQARRFIRLLSDQEIREGALRGKVDAGGRAPAGPVDVDAAIGAALAGFEDGLYLVILDGKEQRDLDAQVFVTDGSRLVFLRLAFLAGA
ncbi:MAG TPA: hypothetical protein VF158_04100 [Longimicrobiales bacterium]